MREHHLYVMSLEEYPPNKEFVGRNFNAGEVIQLVLRSRSTNRWLPFEYVQMVMMHELAHCKQMNHSKAFWAVRNVYAEQMRGLWGRGYKGDGLWGRGASLETGGWEANAVLPGEVFPEHLCGGTFRSRRRKRKAKPQLSYQERKERRILKKFGRNGVALGADEAVKRELEKGRRVVAKPRVAGSARGRELRAAAALARFETKKKEEVNEETKLKVKVEDETNSEDETESEYEDDVPGMDGSDAVDIDGSRLVDGDGRGMVRVCGDEEQDQDEDVKKELRELQSAIKGPASSPNSKPRSRLITEPNPKPSPRSSKNEGTGSRQPKAEPTTDRKAIRDIPPQWRKSDSTVTPTTPDSIAKQQACPICAFANSELTLTCTMCSHVLDPDSVPNTWRCKTPDCNLSYRNSGDCGVCGICGQKRPEAA
jgi:DNA-dependent metalloprotease WSS1